MLTRPVFLTRWLLHKLLHVVLPGALLLRFLGYVMLCYVFSCT